MDINSRYRLFDLIDMPAVQKLAAANFRATGMPFSIIDAFDGAILAAQGWSEICTKYHRASKESSDICRESDDYMHAHIMDKEGCRYRCKNGLWHIGIPIVVAGHFMATLFLSQFLSEGDMPDRKFFIGLADKYGFNSDSYLAALSRVPVFSEEKIASILDYNRALARFIEDMAEQSLRIIATREELLQSEKKYRSLVENISLGVYRNTAEPEGRFISVNPAMAQIFGYASPEELLAVPVANLYQNPKDRHVVTEEIKARKSVRGYELALRKKDGTPIWGSCSISAQFDTAGNLKWMDGVVEDITARKLIEEELLKAQKLESVGILAGGIAHDFNNLLTAIMGNISLAKLQTQADSSLKDYLGRAEKASLRAKDLTQRLLTFSRGGTPIKRTISVAELVMNSVGLALSGAKATCEFNIQDPLWPVDADEGQLSQVISNLIINADHAMTSGGKIYVSCENMVVNNTGMLHGSHGKSVKITIRDNGIGIPEEHIGKIFDPYFTTKEHGSGLGLAVVYSIVKNHSGHISVQSRSGEGTTFTIHLPASESSISARSVEEFAVAFGTGRILVMDDEEGVRQVANEMLTHIGFEVTFAANGTEAIDLYKKAMSDGNKFDVVIIDLTIPDGMGGRETVSRLKELDPSVKAIVSSGYSNDPVMSSFMEYGFAGTVLKPYRLGELGEQIRTVLNRTV